MNRILVWTACAVIGAVSPASAAPGVTVNELFELLASDGATDDEFGYSVAVSGTTAIVGASWAFTGCAYLFDTTTGTQIRKLLASDGAAGDRFGISVGISGTTAIVGAFWDDDRGTSSGSAYLFNTVTGAEIAKLVPDDGVASDEFGRSVAISGSTAIVGAHRASGVRVGTGAAYLFDATTGTQLAKLFSSDGNDGTGPDFFGQSVAISGTTAVVGAYGDDDNGTESGSAYLFDTTTSAQTKLLPDFGHAQDQFGLCVAISGTTAIVGAPYNDDAMPESGAAYVFDTLTGAQTAKLTASDANWSDAFGYSVAIDGATAVVGALYGDDTVTTSGSAYVFDMIAGTQLAELLPSDGADLDLFGRSAAISGGTAVLGAPWHDDAGDESGAAYVFDLAPFLSFCDGGDGSLASCPCSNPGDPYTGCDIPQATGGVSLTVLAQSSSPNRATVQGTGFSTMGSPTVIVIRSSLDNLASPVVFGDGIRCLDDTNGLVRLGQAVAVGGVSTHTFGNSAVAGAGIKHYQLWFRSNPSTYCDALAAFNLSNGRSLIW